MFLELTPVVGPQSETASARHRLIFPAFQGLQSQDHTYRSNHG